MRCLIFTGGELTDPDWHRRQIRRDDYLLCADKGAEYLLSLGWLPHLVVGDMDSLASDAGQMLAARGVPLKNFPSEKNETDTELALLEAVKLQPSEIIIFAGTGDRWDHSLANIFLLAGYLWADIPIALVSPTQSLRVTNKSIKINGFPRQTVSLLAISPLVRDLSLKGFYYPLEKATLSFGTSLGISNELLGEEGLVELGEGVLLIIQQQQK